MKTFYFVICNGRNVRFRANFQKIYWLPVADFLLLGWIGQKPVKDIYVLVGQVATVFYFLFFVALIPAIGTFETKLSSYNIKK